ncbi:uncharacterized protein LOC110251890 [Exaiptasia diaphana]|uniref:Integrase core domain-containing protein n=1 Tax=Exaiptasia diaphana TaxID=2652724 RepID=A0A913Y2Z6_EXADI|nr:uncharacterized protein LOC110251890 [Exaiptasia diaphana]
MLTGLLRSRGHRIGERATASALREINPAYHRHRQRGTERLRNPTPYYAEYAGHKLHMDQNEKLAEYGLTHVIASDGFSGKIVGASSMPVKNNITIYDEVYRAACLQYGIWDQVRVDYGREFYLVLYKQECLRDMRTNTNRQPFMQTQSKQNHIAERVWVEVNHRSTYPMKRVLVNMKGRDLLDMEDDCWKGCMSEFLISVCRSSIQNLIDAWNSRSIPGKGIPNLRFQANFRCAPVTQYDLPNGYELSQEYTQLGGQITEFSPYGSDPLLNDFQAKENRDRLFFSRYVSFENVAHAIANHQEDVFEQALLHYINLTLHGSYV